MTRKTKIKQSANDTPQPKIGKVESLLQRDEGASIDELAEATGWQKHTMRAALTGLRKRGRHIIRTSVDGVSRYTMTAPARP